MTSITPQKITRRIYGQCTTVRAGIFGLSMKVSPTNEVAEANRRHKCSFELHSARGRTFTHFKVNIIVYCKGLKLRSDFTPKPY